MENFDDPIEMHNQIWSLMEKAVKNRNSPFHTPTLVTLENEKTPTARTLV